MKNHKKQLAESAMEDERKYRAPALEKGLDILELLARNGSPMTTSQMAATLGRSGSELFRMVLALEYRGYIVASPEGREGYMLTNKLFTLGIAQGSARSLLEAALPAMKELSREVGQSCHLVVASGDQIVVVARIESATDLGFSVRVGYRRRLIDTNSGLLLYGLATPEVQANWLPQLKDSARDDPERIDAFLTKSAAAAERGYIQSPSEFVAGVTDTCMPIMGMQGAVASLIVPFIAIKQQKVTAEQVLDALRIAVTKIAEALNDDGR